jgi:hypothetical protein
MRDLFLIYTYHDASRADDLAGTFASRGLELAAPAALWPGERILKRIDRGRAEARFAVIIVTDEFLRWAWTGLELDALAERDDVISIMCDSDEGDVTRRSKKLAVASIPGCFAEGVVRLVRLEE